MDKELNPKNRKLNIKARKEGDNTDTNSGFLKKIITTTLSDMGMTLMEDIIIPQSKKIFEEAVHLMLYGKTISKNSTSTSSKVSYRSYYDDKDRDRTDGIRASSFKFNNIILDTRMEAEEVLDNMYAILEDYGIVSIADLYDMVNLDIKSTDYRYGWKNLKDSEIRRCRDGNGYVLVMPKAIPIK